MQINGLLAEAAIFDQFSFDNENLASLIYSIPLHSFRDGYICCGFVSDASLLRVSLNSFHLLNLCLRCL